MLPPQDFWGEDDAPAFSAGNPHLYVPFRVRPFRRARVAWLNRRWLATQGFDVEDAATRRTIADGMLARFGVAAPHENDPDDLFLTDRRTLFADRYGASSGSAHGGSGRVGTLGRFNAKGIGRTPLVSVSTDFYHGHGCMWLEEAIRETILAEFSARVMPHGAVPVVAVIDAGCGIVWGSGEVGARRALVVRPAFLRLASFMRSILFGTSGSAGSDQHLDELRVRAMWRARWPGAGVEAVLGRAFVRMGEQYGAGRALRLWPGPPFASNVTLDGSLVDFGSFRAVPDWSRVQGEVPGHGFGGERMLVGSAARTLERIGRRYGFAFSAERAVAAFEDGCVRGDADQLERAGISAGSAEASALAALRIRQRSRVVGLAGDGVGGVVAGLSPFRSLFRERLLERAERLISGLPDEDDERAGRVGAFIDREIGAFADA